MTFSIESAINRIREFRTSNGLAKNRIATMAGIPEGCVRDIDEATWNPTVSTIKKIEKIIPPEFTINELIKPTRPTRKRGESKEIRA